MGGLAIAGILLIGANIAVSYRGFNSPEFMAKFAFETDAILRLRDYKRIITSGFLHVGWMHLGFNMFTLYVFSRSLEPHIGIGPFTMIYFASLIGGSLFALYIHRNKSNYSMVGASGAVTGILFAAIALKPGMVLHLFLIPIGIPGWLFGLLYTIYSIYGMRAQRDNIGHEAHFGGGLVGLAVAVIMFPNALLYNYWPILAIAVPAFAFLIILWKSPNLLLSSKPFSKPEPYMTQDDKFNTEKISRQEELDTLLDKIQRKGIDGLSKKEKNRLEELSR